MKWAEKKGYRQSEAKAIKIYVTAKEGIPTLSSSTASTKMLATLLCDDIIQQEVKRKFGKESLFFERPFNKCMAIVDVTDRNDFFQWLLHMDSKVKILRTEELQMQFVEYVRRRYTDYLEQYRL